MGFSMEDDPQFSHWVRWVDRKDLSGRAFPGVYAIARSESDLTGLPFSWREDIIYIGMTNSAAGLHGRLGQFDSTIGGRRLTHGGADRVRFAHRDYHGLVKSLYVSIVAFECDPKSNLPTDLRTMGEVARFEYSCLADFAERFNRLPPFNDKVKSPKFSRSVVDDARPSREPPSKGGHFRPNAMEGEDDDA
jgi:hypothetical protein